VKFPLRTTTFWKKKKEKPLLTFFHFLLFHTHSYHLDQQGKMQAKPVHKINFGRSNSMPIIAEYGRLASFPTDDHLSSLPATIVNRVVGVNQRHSDLAKKKIVLQARASAIKVSFSTTLIILLIHFRR